MVCYLALDFAPGWGYGPGRRHALIVSPLLIIPDPSTLAPWTARGREVPREGGDTNESTPSKRRREDRGSSTILSPLSLGGMADDPCAYSAVAPKPRG